MVMTGRERCLGLLVEHLAGSSLGRRLGLDRVATIRDLQASVPVMDAVTHAREVEAQLGFGLLDRHDSRLVEQLERERTWAVDALRARTRTHSRVRLVILWAGPELHTKGGLLADLAAIDAELIQIDRLEPETELRDRLLALAPDVLVAPSVFTMRWVERVLRGPLDRWLPSVVDVLAEHDLEHTIRASTRVRAVGWFHTHGRIGVPAPHASARHFTLAVGTTILELLPQGDPEIDGRLRTASVTVLPEQARIGQRYEIVLTSVLGCLRLRTGEHVRVVGFDPPTREAPIPRPRVVRIAAPPPDIALESVTLSGAWLGACVRQAFHAEDPAFVAARIGAESVSTVWHPPRGAQPPGGKARRLEVEVEVLGHATSTFTKTLASRIDAALRRRSSAYEFLRAQAVLLDPTVQLVSPGSRAAKLSERVRALQGSVWRPPIEIF